MEVARRRLWSFLGLGAIGLQALSVFLATITTYIYVATNLQYCTPDQGACASFDLAPVPTHPYLWLGVVLFAVGSGLLVIAFVLRRRSPPRPRAAPVGV